MDIDIGDRVVDIIANGNGFRNLNVTQECGFNLPCEISFYSYAVAEYIQLDITCSSPSTSCVLTLGAIEINPMGREVQFVGSYLLDNLTASSHASFTLIQDKTNALHECANTCT